VRGTRQADELRGKHLLSIYHIQEWKVLVQMEVDSKENEIIVAPQALEKVHLTGKIISADAMHTQRSFSAQIVDAGGDYIFPVKENQPRLYQDIQQLFAPEHPKPGFGKIRTDFTKATQVNKGHGRLEIRIITTSEMLNAHVDWPGLGLVYRLERQFNWLRAGTSYRQTCEIEYCITSLSRTEATPLQILQKRRDHWYIETGLHYRRDITFREDTTRMTTGNMGSVMASINNLTLTLIMQAGFHNAVQGRRWFAGHLDHAFELLTTTNSRL
jgi:predicted transposase YbfD/YdcC